MVKAEGKVGGGLSEYSLSTVFCTLFITFVAFLLKNVKKLDRFEYS